MPPRIRATPVEPIVEQVRYEKNGIAVTATRRMNGDQEQWVFNAHTVFTLNGYSPASAPFTESVAESVEDRDRMGSKLVAILSKNRETVQTAESELKELLEDVFPGMRPPGPGEPGGPTPPVNPVPDPGPPSTNV